MADVPTRSPVPPRQGDAVLGCLLGGAVGDALGAPVEFLAWEQIRQQFGAAGIADFVPAYGQRGAITDDTQMMLFSAEGLLRAHVRAGQHGLCHPPATVHHALLRWLLTQRERAAMPVGHDGWLYAERQLWSRRAPGNTCLAALRASRWLGQPADNASKGCGGLMRAAPCAFFADAFELAAESARLTHGHPTGYLAAGLFADILARVWAHGLSLAAAAQAALAAHGARPGMAETAAIVRGVLRLHEEGMRPTPRRLERLGGGWTAEEALAIGLWCALAADSLEEGIVWAVNHGGDSDSTGLVAGHFLGLLHGAAAIPARWLAALELREVIGQVAGDLAAAAGGAPAAELAARYPGW